MNTDEKPTISSQASKNQPHFKFEDFILTDKDDAATEDEEPLWSIDDDTLFYPGGLINLCNGNDKSIFITWGDEYILNYRFKKSKLTKRVEVTKVRIMLPENEGEVSEIHVLDLNTLVLMSTGHVYYFSSLKTLNIIDWLDGVRCYSRAAQGFSVIRYEAKQKRLLLETYDDVACIGKTKSTLRYSYDITYDEQNIFNSDWSNDTYTLHTHTIEMQYLQFYVKIIGNEKILNKEQDLHIFSISGHIFALIANDETDFEIVLLNVYAVPVKSVKFLPHINLCLIFLTSGNIDVWYISKLIDIKQRQMHFTGADILSFDATCESGDFYYTDDDHVARLKFQYDTTKDNCIVTEQVLNIPGMVACTWVEQTQQLICLSNNNIFYRISFDVPVPERNNEGFHMAELTESNMDDICANAALVDEYKKLLPQLQAEIESEHKKQQLIAVCNKKHIYAQLLEAEITYCFSVPTEFNDDTALFYTCDSYELRSDALIALMEIKFTYNDIFKLAAWQIFIFHGSKVSVLHIPLDLLTKKRCIIVLPRIKDANEVLPEIKLQYVSMLKVEKEFHAVTLPILLNETPYTYSALFTHKMRAYDTHSGINLKDIASGFEEDLNIKVEDDAELGKEPTVQILRLPSSNSFKCILDSLHLKTTAVVNNILNIYFMNRALIISYIPNNNTLHLESKDASAIYYFKLHLLLNHETLINSTEDAIMLEAEATKSDEEVKELIMRLQCELEQFDINDDVECDREKLDQLYNIYYKIRKELHFSLSIPHENNN